MSSPKWLLPATPSQGDGHCFLTLQESLQGQKFSLTHVSFKFLPLCWPSKCGKFCACFKSEVSVSSSPLVWLYTSPTFLQSYRFWWLIFPVQNLWVRSLMWLWHSSPFATVIILLFWSCLPRRYVLNILHFHPSYPSPCGSFFICVFVENLFC